MQDIDLLNEFHKNPNQALEYIIEQYSGLVYCIINTKISAVGTEEDVKDCVSDVFIEFYQQVNHIDLAKGSIKVFLAVIAKRRGIDLYRRLIGTSGHIIEIDDKYEQIKDDRIDLEQEMIHKEQRKYLLHAIATLGEPDKEIFIRKYYLGQKTKEIAEVLKLRENTVDKKISRGLKKLRIMMGGVDDERAKNDILAK